MNGTGMKRLGIYSGGIILLWGDKALAASAQGIQQEIVAKGFGQLFDRVSPIAPFLYLSYMVFFAGFYLFYRMEKGRFPSPQKEHPRGIVYLLGSAFVLRLLLAPLTEGFSVDMNLFRFWSQEAARDLFGIYQGDFFLDYPPLYLYVLALIGRIADFLNLAGGEPLYRLLLKLPSMGADILTGYLLYRLAQKHLSGVWPMLFAGVYVFNPAILVNAAVWGQVDSFLVMLLALGFVLLDSDKPAYAGLAFAAAVLTKPQGLIFMPIVLYELLKRKDLKRLLKTAGCGVALILLLILPFALRQDPLWIVRLYLNTADGYQYASLNAFNFFSLIGANLRHDSLPFLFMTYKAWGFLFIFVFLVYTAVLYIKGKGAHLPYMGALVLSLGVFMFAVRMHERYMFPVLFFFLVVTILTRDKWGLLFYGVASVTVFLNTYVVLVRMMVDQYPHVPPEDALMIFLSLLNVLLLLAVMVWSWGSVVKGRVHTLPLESSPGIKKGARGRRRVHASGRASYERGEQGDYPRLSIHKKDVLMMVLMTGIYLAIALVNLGGRDIPQTHWRAGQYGEGFIVDLGEVQDVSRMTYFSGLGDGEFSAFYMDAGGAYQPLENLRAGNQDFYKWRTMEIPAPASRIRVEVKKPGGALNEVAFFTDPASTPLPITILHLDGTRVEQGDLLHLADEQDIAQYRPSYLNGTYFDEIYHARTAYEHIHHIKPYEWTHPPLGKLLIAAGISLFGMNPFGWRIVGTLVGAAMIPLMYLFGKKLFQRSLYGFIAAFLMMFDFMHFAQTRIATIDVYTTFFVILMYYFMADYYLRSSYKWGFYRSLVPLLLSGICFGLGIAVKWSVLYGAPGLALLFVMAKYNEYKVYQRVRHMPPKEAPPWVERFVPLFILRTCLYCVLFFIIIPGGLYLLSYIPTLQVPGLQWRDVFKYQQSMYIYHSGLQAGHSFSSEWWSWPFMIRPIWYYQGVDLPGGQVSTIASFGNPAVWWAGIAAVVAACRAAFKRNKAMILVVVAIGAQYLPWVLVPRAAFIYHFFPIVPFVILAIVFSIKGLIERGLDRRMIYGYMALTLLLFILFYPAISGLIVNKGYIDTLRWFPTWIF